MYGVPPNDIDAPARILICDEDKGAVELLSHHIQHHGHTVEVADGGAKLIAAITRPFDVILLDRQFDGAKEFEALDRVARDRPGISVVMLSDTAETGQIVEAMRHGAFDVLTRPFDLQRLAISVRNGAAQTRLKLASAGLRAAMIRDDGGPDLICASQAMSEVISLVERVASSEVPVLIHGESGAGKEVVAHRIHARSGRRDGPFVSINCTALPADMLETELFGTGDDPGKLEKAAGGTLFLDEVGELDIDLQTRLLRVLQESGHEARIVAATSRHLPSEVSRGRFRADLFYRLNVFSVSVPPLRDRREDIPALARYASARIAKREGRPSPQLSEEALTVLRDFDWPGNVRELNNVIERAVLLSSGEVITTQDLPDEMIATAKKQENEQNQQQTAVPVESDGGSIVRPLKDLEREMMIAALKETRGNVSEAARRLGIGRATFYRRAQRHGLTRDDGFPG